MFAIWTITCDNFETVRDRMYYRCKLVLITNGKSHIGFRLVSKARWPWMTLNGVIAFILCYFTEFDSFAGRLAYVTVVEDMTYVSAGLVLIDWHLIDNSLLWFMYSIVFYITSLVLSCVLSTHNKRILYSIVL